MDRIARGSKAFLMALAALLVVAMLALAACGSQGGSPSSSADASSSSASASESESSSASASESESSSSEAEESSSSSEAVEEVAVPNVVSLSREDAEAEIKAAGLELGSVKEKSSESVEEGKVISQKPEALEMVAPGTEVKLAVSSGKPAPAQVEVPSIVGETKGYAEEVLREAGLKPVYDGESETTAVDAGLVMGQSIEPGKVVDEGTEVSFAVAKKPERVSVPDVVGKKKDAAKKAVKKAGFTFKSSEEHSDSVKKGRVISQDPAAGSKLDPGSTVKVVISKGPKEAKVAVPNVVGKKYSDAKKALKNAGLKVKRKGSSDGTVKSQSPAAGEMVAKGKTVTVKVEKKQDDKVKVPDVVGQSAQMAADTLDSMGLVPDMDGQIHGTVVKQNPKAGKKVKKGTKVKLDIDTSAFK